MTRPDLMPPVVTVDQHGTVGEGLILFTPNDGLAPDGLLIVDNDGQPVWCGYSRFAQAVNLRVASYRNQPVLTWWEGSISHRGIGDGEFVIADTGYRELARVRAANGYQGDLHEFILTPEGTALFLIANWIPWSAAPSITVSPSPGATSPAGPPKLIECVLQEVDISTGRLLLEWHSTPAIDLAESYQPVPSDGSDYDYLHANSIDVAPDGNLVLSCRHTWAVYGLDRTTGSILWQLGGKRSDFRLGPGASFAWQHDARMHADSTISLFDNESSGQRPNAPQSRGVQLALDTRAKTANLVRQWEHPAPLLAGSQGSCELLATGGAFIGWGERSQFSEFDRAGAMVFDASFPSAKQSYRAMRVPWSGYPTDAPAVAVRRGASGDLLLYASWNGATDVAWWEFLGGPDGDHLEPIGLTARRGFETSMACQTQAPFVRACALNESGAELGRSAVIAAG